MENVSGAGACSCGAVDVIRAQSHAANAKIDARMAKTLKERLI